MATNTTSMESKLSLALAVKLKEMFEPKDRPDKFLTFPRGIGFTYQYLSFMRAPGESGLSAVDQQNIKCDFARVMNSSFSDSAQYSPDASIPLWQQFEKILRSSIFPQTTLTDQEEKHLAEAIQFLTTSKTDESGVVISVPSAAYNDYIRYKTIYDKATSVYLDEKLSAENETGPDGDRRTKDWDLREKELKDAITRAENDWLNLGHKLQIENYQAIKNSLEQKKYVNLVQNAYLVDLEQSDVPDLMAGFPTKLTFFSPFDVTDKSIPWISLNLARSEMDHFVQQAPSELKAMFNSGEGSDDIESVSLEYNTIAIIRPWWKPEYLSSRYWKLPDESVISDGNIPCRGTIPAYISSMIVARNIAIKRRKTASDKPATQPIIPILSAVSVNKQAEMMLSSRSPAPMRMIARPTGPVEPIALARQPAAKKVVATQTFSNVKFAGTAIATPVFVPPPVKPQTPTTIDLAQLAGDPQSRWASGRLVDDHNTTEDSSLPWMGGEGDSRGFVRSDQNVLMEDGQAWATVLRTHPKWVDRGTIKGWLAWRPIRAGAHFQAKVGFLRGAAGTDGVTFWVWVHYMSGGVERWTPVAQHFKKYTQSLDSIDVDLGAYAGQSISIELRVDAGPSSGQDWAAWVNPTIALPTNSGTSETDTQVVTETYPFDGIVVLAYVCKRVSKSPNPDFTLKWS